MITYGHFCSNCRTLKGSGNLRLKCKKWQKTLVYIDGRTVQKSLPYEQKLQKPLEIPIFQFASGFKIRVDSFLTACNILENWMKSMAKQGYIYTFFFLAKIVTTKIWPSEVQDYSNKNNNWTITPLSTISLMPQHYFFLTSIDYNKEKTSHSKRKIIKVQKRCDWGACPTMNGITLEGSI